MSYHTDNLKLASNFQPLAGEANFPPPITKEVVGGAHIAPHCITVQDSRFVLVDWHRGLPRHDKPGERAIRFPHGLMLFGESFEACAERLVGNQLGMKVESVNVVHVYSYLDEMKQWHMEPILVVHVTGQPKPPEEATAVFGPIGPTLPEGGVWKGKPPFRETYDKYLKKFLE